ncbi:glycosyltransferase [Sporomusa sp.]|uniref:glycosyltransferase n=1 Tax=Sporomusa sp. TaxID=2078658 RepID=UPI002BB03512|nr:glycosyltransferase [Sporomusa sp.]HWR45836.1 glycosyltransferase [Sporomusa sp.]
MNNLSEKKRVAFLFGHLHKGGMQKAVSNISCALPEDIEQYVLFFGSENPEFNYNAKLVDLNIPGKKDRSIISRIHNCFIRIKVLQKFIDDNCITTVVSFGEVASLLNLMTKRARKVISVRVSIDEQFDNLGCYGWGMKQLIRFLYPNADLVVPVSRALGDQLVEKYGVSREKIRTIYNLYDIDKIQYLSGETLTQEEQRVFEKPTIINVGNLCYQKGQDHLIQAFAKAKKQLPDLQLVIIGEGELRDELTQLGNSLGVSESIHMLGFKSNPYKYIDKADVFVLTSRFEGFPNALVEAMACGIPVISVDCNTGPGEILGDSEYGILIPQFSGGNRSRIETSLCSNIIRLLADTNERTSFISKATDRCRDFSHYKVIPQWYEIMK